MSKSTSTAARRSAPTKGSTTTAKPRAAKPKGTPKPKPVPIAVVPAAETAADPNKNRYNNGLRDYPLPTDVLAFTGDTGRGKDQKLRLSNLQSAAKKHGNDKTFTAEAAIRNGATRRCIRRAVRAGLVTWAGAKASK